MEAPSLEVTAILSDAAQANGGKLYVIGGGWTRLQPNIPATAALGLVIHVPFDKTNQPIKVEATLRDDEAQPVQIGGNTVAAAGEFEVGRPPGTKPGEDLNVPLAFTFNGLALPKGGYVFEVTIAGETKARCPFRVA